jgi:hypothetical protein
MARAIALVLTGLGLLGVIHVAGGQPVALVVGVTVLAVYVAGFLAEVTPAGVWAGLVAAGLWGLPVLISPPIPTTTTWAFAAVGFGGLAATVLARTGRTSAALTAGAVGALVVAGLGTYFPVFVVGGLFAGAQAVRLAGQRVLKTTS